MTTCHFNDEATYYLLRIIFDRYLTSLDSRVSILAIREPALEDRVERL